MSNYIAITIGPIYKTFSLARRVKEFWAVSYMFSQLMKVLTREIYDSKSPDKKSDILLPCVENPDLFELKKVGLFPDWIIYKSDNEGTDYRNLPGFIKNAKNALSQLLVVKDVISIDEIDRLLDSYLKIYYFEEELKEDQNPIHTLSPRLHQFELLNPVYNDDFTPVFYKIFNNLKETKLYIDHFRKAGSEERHLSMEEIATRGLVKFISPDDNKKLNKILFDKEIKEDNKIKLNEGKLNKDGNESGDFFKELIRIIKTKEKDSDVSSFKTYHKYVAIVKADGDKIGKALEELKKGDEGAFSNSLLQWGLASKNIIESFEGLPIYIGGDDLLFFAPVVNKGINIIQVIEEINKAFNAQFINYRVKPSLSFGVSITFYKYPLYEALENADALLQNVKDIGGNGIFLQLLKHSGTAFKINLSFNDDDKRKEIVNRMMSEDEKSSVISSVSYDLRDNEKVFGLIGNKPQRINQFFENNIEGFKEKRSKYLQAIKDLVVETFDRKITAILLDTYKESMNEIYDTIRFTKFLKGFDENDR